MIRVVMTMTLVATWATLVVLVILQLITVFRVALPQ